MIDKIQEDLDNVVHKEMENVVVECCNIHNISHFEFHSKSRLRYIIDCRTMAFYFIRKVLDITYPKMAKHFNKNHATIIHAVNKHDDMMEYDVRYKDKYLQLQYKLMDQYPAQFQGNIIYQLKKENDQLKKQLLTILETGKIDLA